MTDQKLPFRQKGFTLIELMIALLIGFLVVAAVLTIYITTIRGSSNTMKMTRLNQDMSVAMLIMSNDIRRAGYWGGAITGADLTLNPFNHVEVRDVGAAALQNPVVGTPVSGNCITYSYDANAWPDAAYNIADSNAPDAGEYFGFRLSNGAIQIKTQGTTSQAVACNDGAWVNLTDPDEITITNLQFTLAAEYQATNAAGNTVTARSVNISLSGQSESDSTIRADMSDIVKIRNNRIEP
jgi:type IV pilus assembly protein PilW